MISITVVVSYLQSCCLPNGGTALFDLLCVCVLVSQSCPTLCDLLDWSPLGSSVRGILQTRMLLLLLLLSHFSRVRLCATPWTAAHQAPLSLGFSRQEHWSGLPFPFLMHESEVAQSCLTLSDPMDSSPPGSSITST